MIKESKSRDQTFTHVRIFFSCFYTFVADINPYSVFKIYLNYSSSRSYNYIIPHM